jgi:gliding motility-associated-like protein
LAPNTYTFTVTNAAGCTSASSLSATINAQPATPSAPVVGTITQPTCTTATGSVDLSGLPASGTWTVTATPGGSIITGTGTTGTFSGLVTGTYTFTVTNAAGCTSVASSSAVINAQPATPAAPTGPTAQAFCSGASPTVADLTAIGSLIQWYATSSGGTALPPSTPLVNNTHYYASQTVSGCESNTRLDVAVTVFDPATASVGVTTATICEGMDYTLGSAVVSNNNSLLWTTSGTGTFSNATILNPTYTPSAADITAGTVILTLTAYGNAPCGNATSSMTLDIIPAPEAYAGADETICEGSAYTITDATASNYTGILWISNGMGTLTNATTLTPTYTPATNEVGTVTLTLTVYGNIPCGAATDFMLLQITPKATADAGPDISTCAAVPVTLVAATASYYNSLIWSTSGSGTFNNPTILNPVYTPSPSDILNGYVVLTLTAVAEDPCPAASDNMTLTISKEAVADAGPDQATCEGVSYMIMGASAQNYASILWTHNGMGTLTNASTITPTYNPAAGETGKVTLTLTVTPVAPCQAVTDQMVLTISKSATANAGPDATSCGPDPFTLLDASAKDYNTITWTTSGTGNFNDPHIEKPVYTPSLMDILIGTVILTMTVVPDVPCPVVVDNMTLTLTGTPVANAGPNGSTCAGVPFTVTGATAVNYSSILWTTNGLGVLSGPTTLTPTYTPAAGESGTITLTLTIYGAGGCNTITATSQMNILVSPPIIVNAGNDQTIPRNSYTTLLGTASGGSGVFAFSWQPATLLIGASTDHPETVRLTNDVTFFLTVTDLITDCQNTDSVRIHMDQGIETILAVNDYDTTAVNFPIDINVLSNDSYSKNLTVGVTLCGGPGHGLADVLSDNTIHYTPTFDFTGHDSLCYIVCYNQYPDVCDTAEVYIFISSKSPAALLIIYNVITPNGDGINDEWFIDGIEKFPDNTVLIFNRWGDKVHSFEHYNNSSQIWKGDNDKGEPLPDGTYYYILTIKDGGTRTGWVWIRGSSE